ncbi:MAG: exodeoxyribonuclease VII small subunit [Parasporobacterium sp.]|nr:exodeoxyribonuclease VII small subunit [Parasporobacterium sp.]
MARKVKNMTIEENLEKLEEITRNMEQGDLSLEESLKLFEEGIRLVKTCTNQIDHAEKTIQILEEQDAYDPKEPY